VKNIIGKLHKVFESRIRLGIMSVLMVNEWVDFNTFKEVLQITDGNLASHLTGLEKNGLIEVSKQFVGRKPNTKYKASDKGKRLFKEHLDQLGELISSQNL
jgi:DNA-binding HxlR family transcriptional regulator